MRVCDLGERKVPTHSSNNLSGQQLTNPLLNSPYRKLHEASLHKHIHMICVAAAWKIAFKKNGLIYLWRKGGGLCV